MFTRVSPLKQVMLIAAGFSTALGLDIVASVLSLAFRYTQGESEVSNVLPHLDPRRADGVLSDRERQSMQLELQFSLSSSATQRSSIMFNHITRGSHHWETELDYNPSRDAWRAGVPVSDCISTSFHYQTYSGSYALHSSHLHHNDLSARDNGWTTLSLLTPLRELY